MTEKFNNKSLNGKMEEISAKAKRLKEMSSSKLSGRDWMIEYGDGSVTKSMKRNRNKVQKKDIARKMKVWRQDGVGGKRPHDTNPHPDQASFDKKHGGKKFKADYNDEP